MEDDQGGGIQKQSCTHKPADCLAVGHLYTSEIPECEREFHQDQAKPPNPLET